MLMTKNLCLNQLRLEQGIVDLLAGAAGKKRYEALRLIYDDGARDREPAAAAMPVLLLCCCNLPKCTFGLPCAILLRQNWSAAKQCRDSKISAMRHVNGRTEEGNETNTGSGVASPPQQTCSTP